MIHQSQLSLSLLGFKYLNWMIVIFRELVNLYNSAYLADFFCLFWISRPAWFKHFRLLLVPIIVSNFTLLFAFISSGLLVSFRGFVFFFVLFLLLFVTQILNLMTVKLDILNIFLCQNHLLGQALIILHGSFAFPFSLSFLVQPQWLLSVDSF